MKTSLKLISFVLTWALFAVACSEETKKKIKDAKQAVSATTSYVENASNVQNDVERLQKLTPLTNQELKAWLPESVGDLTRTGFKLGQGVYMKVSSVEGTYKAEGSKQALKITVIDGAGPTGSALAASYAFIGAVDAETENEQKHQQLVTVNGVKAQQTYFKKRNNTQLTFLHNKRFLVTVNSTDMDADQTWTAVKKMQLNKLAE